MYDIDHLILQEYSGQTGYGSLPYFVGKQYGTGWLRNIARFAFPFLRKALGALGNFTMNTADDLIQNENKGFKDTVTDNVMKEASRIMKRKASNSPPGSSINGRGISKRRKLII